MRGREVQIFINAPKKETLLNRRKIAERPL